MLCNFSQCLFDLFYRLTDVDKSEIKAMVKFELFVSSQKFLSAFYKQDTRGTRVSQNQTGPGKLTVSCASVLYDTAVAELRIPAISTKWLQMGVER